MAVFLYLLIGIAVAVDMGKYRTRSSTNPQRPRFDYTGLDPVRSQKWYLDSRGAHKAKQRVLKETQLQRQALRPRNSQKGRRKKLTQRKAKRKVQRLVSTNTKSISIPNIDALDQNENIIDNDIDESKISVDDNGVSAVSDIDNVNIKINGKHDNDLHEALKMVNQQINELKKHKKLTPKHLQMFEKCSILKMYLLQRMEDIPKMSIYENIYNLFQFTGRTVRSWVSALFGGDSGRLTPVSLSQQGDHPKIAKGLQTVEHHYRFKLFVYGLIRKRKPWGTHTVANWVNTVLLKEEVAERGPYSNRTIRQWLIDAGFTWHRFSKSEYPDGHERPDVIEVS